MRSQDVEIVRPEPPSLDDFESDEDKDGVPDGWYNIRDAKLVSGGVVGPTCLRVENAGRGRPARASRAFGVDGRKYEAIVVGLWVKVSGIRHGERMGEDPSLFVEFLREDLKSVRRDSIGPWTKTPGDGWAHVAKRMPVPLNTTDALLTIGLVGAAGTLDVDGLTVALIPRGPQTTENLILNSDLELGDVSRPTHWVVEGGARRCWPGDKSDSAVELARDGAKLLAGLARSPSRFGSIEFRLRAKGTGLRGSGGAAAEVYFLDDDGKPLSGRDSGARVARFSGSFDWTDVKATIPVPRGAGRAVLQIEKTDLTGSLKVDNIEASASPTASLGAWSPYHVATDTGAWPPFAPSTAIEKGSALDASTLVPGPAGTKGAVVVKDGRLHFSGTGERARFFGVVLLPPLAFPDPDRAEALADRLAQSGVNLVRFDDLDAPYGPGRSLFDDSRDDTRALDPEALARFDHLVALLKARGIYISLEIQAARIYRDGDGLSDPGALPVGGGPALAFDPKMKALAVEGAKLLLGHVNPETKRTLKDDPVLAWVVLSGEQTLFDLIDDRDALSPRLSSELREIGEKRSLGTGRRLWQTLEAGQWKAIADDLRKFGVKAPIAGCSHWRREPEFTAAQAASGLDGIDDRLFWAFPTFGSPDRRSMLWKTGSSMSTDASHKRKADRPYVVGQWCARTGEAWSLPYEGADLLLTAHLAASEDWDATARRGLFLHPASWGANAPGTAGIDDLFFITEVVNALPPVFALLPHAASVALRGTSPTKAGQPKSRGGIWDPSRGRLVIDTPHTVALAGWGGRLPASAEGVTLRVDSPYGVVAVSSLSNEPIAASRRLLVTSVGRVEPTGLLWADENRRDPAEPGLPPLRLEPIHSSVVLRRTGTWKAYRLDNNGRRAGAALIAKSGDGWVLTIDGEGGTVHWEIVEE